METLEQPQTERSLRWEKLSPGWYRSNHGDQITKDGATWWLMMPGRAPAYTQHKGRVSAQREAARVRGAAHE